MDSAADSCCLGALRIISGPRLGGRSCSQHSQQPHQSQLSPQTPTLLFLTVAMEAEEEEEEKTQEEDHRDANENVNAIGLQPRCV